MELFNQTEFPFKLADLEISYREGTLRTLESITGLRIVVADSKYIYVTSKETYDVRMSRVDTMWESSESFVGFLMPMSAVHLNETADGVVYTFGNIYGLRSILLGPKAATMIKTEGFKSMVGKRVKNVVITSRNDQFMLDNFAFRD